MKRAIIIPDKCKNCTDCLIESECKSDAIIRESVHDKPWIDFYKCTGCLKCKVVCTSGAIESIAQPCNGKPRIGW